jgi:hypothetical protein
MAKPAKLLAWLLTSMLGWAGACPQQVQEKHEPTDSAAVAVDASTKEADTTHLVKHLARTLNLSAGQTQQLQQLTLAQAEDEQRMWGQLADTACLQLRRIAMHYDGQVQKLMTRQQYVHFARLRAAASQRRAAKRRPLLTSPPPTVR